MKAAEFPLKNLPLKNGTITSLSALSPSLLQDYSVCTAFITLGRAVPNVVAPEEIGKLDEEVRVFKLMLSWFLRPLSIIKRSPVLMFCWWSPIVSIKNREGGERFRVLNKPVKALLSIFTGPLVEGSFNLMDDIFEADRCSMNIERYEGLTVIKSTLKARQCTASTMRMDQPMRRSCLNEKIMSVGISELSEKVGK
ncbi:hypothetical protein GOODEAATRI_031613 [Goodea atripinnis]|uniref:Uncharacterized protein n=1 Tax=Goodea atripinnis TaxID=208336 RepID=A0ABV0PIK9_9TELE